MFGLFQCPPVSSGPPPPFPTAGLKLWLDVTKGITQSGGIASTWADQSGNGNDATVSGGCIGPQVDANVINGLPGLNSFYTTTVQMGGSGRLLSDGSPYHIITVVRMAPVSAPAQPSGFDIGGGFADIGSSLFSVFGDFFGDVYVSNIVTANNIPIANDTAYEFELASDTSTQSASIGGAALVLTGTVPMPVSGGGWNVFGDPIGGNGPFWGWVCEVLIFDHQVTGSDLASVRAYVTSKYGI